MKKEKTEAPERIWISNDDSDYGYSRVEFEKRIVKYIRADLVEPKWISVKERLPDYKDCLAFNWEHKYKICGAVIASYDKKRGWEDSNFNKITPSHWQPLPEPPNPEE